MGFQIKRMTQRVDREKMRDLFCQIENEKPWDRNNISIQVINPPSPKKSSFSIIYGGNPHQELV